MDELKQEQFYKIPNKLITKCHDSAIFVYIVICGNNYYGVCKMAQETMAKNYGNNRKFYSNAVNELAEQKFIIKKTINTGDNKEHNSYTLINVDDDYTTIHSSIVEKLLTEYKTLAFYLKLKRWINNKTLTTNEIKKTEIANYCGVSKNTSNKYLDELVKLNIIEMVSGNRADTFKITLINEITIKNNNEQIKQFNAEEN